MNETMTTMTTITIRLPQEVVAELRRLAAEGDRSLTAQILRLLREAMKT